jgi:collagen type III alpha
MAPPNNSGQEPPDASGLITGDPDAGTPMTHTRLATHEAPGGSAAGAPIMPPPMVPPMAPPMAPPNNSAQEPPDASGLIPGDPEDWQPMTPPDLATPDAPGGTAPGAPIMPPPMVPPMAPPMVPPHNSAQEPPDASGLIWDDGEAWRPAGTAPGMVPVGVPLGPQRAEANDDDRDRDEAYVGLLPWEIDSGEEEPEAGAQRSVDETGPPPPPLAPATALDVVPPIPAVSGPDHDEPPSRPDAAELLREEEDAWNLADDQVPVLRADEADDDDGWDDVDQAWWLRAEPPPNADPHNPHDPEERMPHAPVGG